MWPQKTHSPGSVKPIEEANASARPWSKSVRATSSSAGTFQTTTVPVGPPKMVKWCTEYCKMCWVLTTWRELKCDIRPRFVLRHLCQGSNNDCVLGPLGAQTARHVAACWGKRKLLYWPEILSNTPKNILKRSKIQSPFNAMRHSGCCQVGIMAQLACLPCDMDGLQCQWPPGALALLSARMVWPRGIARRMQSGRTCWDLTYHKLNIEI